MFVGVPKEIKNQESRVGLTPASVKELTLRGHQVMVQHNAGAAIGLTDEMYAGSGATIIPTAEEIFAKADYNFNDMFTVGARVFFAPDYNQSGNNATWVAGGVRVPLPHDGSNTVPVCRAASSAIRAPSFGVSAKSWREAEDR